MLLAALVLIAAQPAVAHAWSDDGADAPPLPAGLAAVWRVDGRKLAARASAWSIAAFSSDAAFVGVADENGTRIYRVRDGRVVRTLPAPFSTGQSAFSLALSSTGLVAIGRVGGIELHALDDNVEPLKFHCTGVCGPVSALAFAPDGAWLAYQSGRGALERSPGFVHVVDVRERARVAELEASALRAGVMFAADGRTLVAANVTRIDEAGTFGVRTWKGADWHRTRDVPGAAVPRGSIGPFAFDDRLAVFARDGRMEVREVASGALLWASDLVPPALDAKPVPAKLDLVALARRAGFVLSYESPTTGDSPGALVLRRLDDGATIAMYDVQGVNAVAVAPDGGSFVYSTGADRTYTALAHVPR